MSNAPTEEKVLSVEHFTDRLFRFEISRPASFRFRSGEFIMIGLPKTEEQRKPIMRAYSVASPSWDDKLEFYSIKVPDGPLTSRLQQIKEGDTVLLGKKPVGTLVLDALLPGKRLYMFSTGTGIAPFASLIRDPETYERYDQVILTHTSPLNPEEDRVMICGSKDMIDDTAAIVEKFGLKEGSNSNPAEFVVEKSFVG